MRIKVEASSLCGLAEVDVGGKPCVSFAEPYYQLCYIRESFNHFRIVNQDERHDTSHVLVYICIRIQHTSKTYLIVM